MATYCPNPNCEYKLRLIDWKPNCPKCGTNILYYKMEERLLAEADRVETANAAFQKKADRAKAAVVGSKWAIARLVLLALPLITLFLPLGHARLSMPFVEKAETLNAVSVVMALTRLDFDALLAALGNSVLQAAFLWYALAIVGFALVLVAILAGLATCWLARSPGGFKRTVIFFILGLGGTALAAASVLQFGAKLSPAFPGVLSVSLTWYGTGAVALSFLLILAINIYIKATGDIPVTNKQCYISGFPEEEVCANQAKGITLEDMRRARAEKEAEAEAAEIAEAVEVREAAMAE